MDYNGSRFLYPEEKFPKISNAKIKRADFLWATNQEVNK